jgi:damage-control phosphatase, subfamily I
MAYRFKRSCGNIDWLLWRNACMKMNYQCLPCLINQVVKVAEITEAENRDALFKDVFRYLSTVDFDKTNPEIIGATFRLLKEHIRSDDPYLEIRRYYNNLFLNKVNEFETAINRAGNPFEEAIKYAIIGNIIDFSPIHGSNIDDIMKLFREADKQQLTIDHSANLVEDIQVGKTLLYLGDNCGEICLDKILIKKIKEYNPQLELYFGVRGAPVVNDSVEADAYQAGMDAYAKIVSNGDDSLGTVLSRTSEEFNRVFNKADVVIAKGQANYESLSERTDKNIYYLLMTKCDVIASRIGVAQKSIICMSARQMGRV